MSGRRFAMLASIALAKVACGADGPAVSIEMRDSGYLLGDLLVERVRIALPAGAGIDVDSLPAPGRVAPWLEIRTARLAPRDAGGDAGVIVTYQIFAETETPTRVPVPSFKLRIDGDPETKSVEVPAASFLLSPALPAELGDRDRELKPSPAPDLLPRRGYLAGAAASFAIALLALGYLAWHHDRIPFLPRAPGPLARTWRHWRRSRLRSLSADERTRLLRDVHAALNASAGETLYPSTFERLFARAPHLAPLRSDLSRFFERSWQGFFEDADGAPDAISTLALLRRAADRERGVPC